MEFFQCKTPKINMISKTLFQAKSQWNLLPFSRPTGIEYLFTLRLCSTCFELFRSNSGHSLITVDIKAREVVNGSRNYNSCIQLRSSTTSCYRDVMRIFVTFFLRYTAGFIKIKRIYIHYKL